MTAHLPSLPIGFDPLIKEANQRMRRRRLLLAGVIALSLLAYLAVTNLDRGPRVSPTAAVEAGTILSKAQAQHSVHYTSNASSGAAQMDYTTADVANDRGVLRLTQRVFSSKKVDGAWVGKTRWYTVKVVVSGRTGYLRGPAPALHRWLWGVVDSPRAKALRYANRWISFPRSGRLGFLAQGGTLDSFLRQITDLRSRSPRGRLKTSVSTLNGRKVIGITSTTSWGQVWFSADASSLLPIAAGWVAGGQGRTRISHWNEPLHVRAPAHSIPIAAVRHSS